MEGVRIMEPVLDKIGQEIKVGSYIAYGHLLSRSAGLRIGKVLALTNKEDSYRRGTYHLDIVVIGVDDDWIYPGHGPKLNERKGFLQYPNRIIVLNESMVPESYKNLFKE